MPSPAALATLRFLSIPPATHAGTLRTTPLALCVAPASAERDRCVARLLEHGYGVVVANDGQAGLDRALALVPDAIVHDPRAGHEHALLALGALPALQLAMTEDAAVRVAFALARATCARLERAPTMRAA